MKRFNLEKQNSVDLGLPLKAVQKAITWNEFHDWIEYIVAESEIDDLPGYVFDLLEASGKGDVLKMQKPGGSIGFILSSGLDEERYETLWGIGYARSDPSLPVVRTDMDQNVVNHEVAEAALAGNPEVRKWFEGFFEAIGKLDELS